MARFNAGIKTAAGSTTLPIASLYSAAAVGAKIREIGVFNTTTTAVDVKLQRFTTAGTSTAITPVGKHDPDSAAASCTPRGTHSSTAPTAGDDLGYRASLGAAVGSGIIWTFGDSGLRIPVGTANGIGIVVENGTGQACQVYIVWDE